MKNIRKIFFAVLAVAALSLFAPAVIPTQSNMAKVEAKKAKISKKKVTLRKGSSIKLRVKHKKKKVRWFTTNPRIATVKRGRVTAKSPGTCSVYARHGKRRLYCKVTVRDYNFAVSKASLSLNKGESRTITVYSERKSAITVTTNNKYIATATPLAGPGTRVPVKISGDNTAGTVPITVKELSTGKKRIINVRVNGSNLFQLEDSSDTNITLKENESKTLWIRCDLRSAIRLSKTGDSISCSWGVWNGRRIPLTINGEDAASGTSVITLQEPTTGNTLSISVTVEPADTTDN